VVHFEVKTNSDLDKYKGQLKGKIVLSGAVREVKPMFDPMATRLVDTNLLTLANAGEPTTTTTPLTPFAGGAAWSGARLPVRVRRQSPRRARAPMPPRPERAIVSAAAVLCRGIRPSWPRKARR